MTSRWNPAQSPPPSEWPSGIDQGGASACPPTFQLYNFSTFQLAKPNLSTGEPLPLEVNNQNLFQNAQFQQFVDFAETAAAAGKQKAIARVDAGELGGIANRTIKPGSGDWVGVGAGRLAELV